SGKRVTKRFTHANIDIRGGSIIEELFRRYAITSIATTWCVRSTRLLPCQFAPWRGLPPPRGQKYSVSILKALERIKQRSGTSSTGTTSERRAWAITSAIFPTCRDLRTITRIVES